MAKTCEKTSLLQSLNFCRGKSVLPGIRSVVYGAPKSAIATFPTLPDTASAKMSELATYKGSFAMAAEGKFHRIDLSLDKGQCECESQGEGENITFLNKLTLKHPETDADAIAYCRQVVSEDMVYVFQQRDGKWRVLGNKAFPTFVKPKTGTGEGMSGEVGTFLEISCTDVCPCPFYEGSLVTAEDDTIQCGPQAPSPEVP